MSKLTSLHFRCAARVGSIGIEIELNTAPGTLIVIGPNGAGKTSLLEMVLGARPVDRGYLKVGATVLLDTNAAVHVPLEHRRLGYVPQDYALFPHLSVRDNIAFAVESASPRINAPERSRHIDTILHDLRLTHLAGRRTHTLSGGEKQRVALGRALSVHPRALLLDEPLAALDVHAREEVRDFVGHYLKKAGLPTIIVTHDPADALQFGDRIAVLESGKVTQIGTWADLAQRPASRFVEEFVSSASSGRGPVAA